MDYTMLSDTKLKIVELHFRTSKYALSAHRATREVHKTRVGDSCDCIITAFSTDIDKFTLCNNTNISLKHDI